MSIESFRAPGGAQLHYRYDDFTDPWKDAPTIVLAHGFGGFSARWYSWVPLLGAHFKVVRVDLRGLGLSHIPLASYKNVWPDTLTADAIALLEHLKVKKVVWVGEHTGALVGLMLSMRVPDRLHAVGVMGAPPRPLAMTKYKTDETSARQEVLGLRESPEYMRKRGMRQWYIDSVKYGANGHGAGPQFSPAYNAWYLDQMAQEDPLVYAAFRDSMVDINVIPLLKDIGVPVLWLDATNKPVLTEDAGADIIKSHPKIRFREIEGTGGQIAYQYPQVCVAEVRKFLENLNLWPA